MGSAEADAVMRRVRERARAIGGWGALHAATLILLLVFQGLAAAASPARFDMRGGDAVATPASDNCTPSRRGDTTPEPQRHSCAACGILCDWAAYGAPPSGALRTEYTRYPESTVVRVGPPPRSGGAPIGWASSWSSRAPPKFF
jgi:hypothetical protein